MIFIQFCLILQNQKVQFSQGNFKKKKNKKTNSHDRVQKCYSVPWAEHFGLVGTESGRLSVQMQG